MNNWCVLGDQNVATQAGLLETFVGTAFCVLYLS